MKEQVLDPELFELSMAPSGELAKKSASRIVKPPFGYFGAKHRVANWIIETLPPHSAWVEAFCGSAAVTLAKKPADIEVINDLDGQVVNLFRVLREQPDDLRRVLQLTPYAREEFEIARSDEVIIDCLERARRFLVATMMTVNGSAGTQHSGFSFSDSYVRGGREARVNRWYQLPERLEQVVERLRSVRIENKDARQIIRQFSSRPATLMYLDPPYLMDRRTRYAVDANEIEFHSQLLEESLKADCMIIISGYENELYLDTLTEVNGWTKVYLDTTTRGTLGKDIQRTEVLWMNEAFQEGVKSNNSRVNLSAQEEREKKVNPKRSTRSKDSTTQ